jgi:hypothetical protein
MLTLDEEGLSGPALRTFFRIAEAWNLSNEEQMTLLCAERSTYDKWKRERHGLLPKDTLERISYILGIYKTLHILLPNDQAADTWIRRSNTALVFGGKSALDRMLSGQASDLYAVHQYLAFQYGNEETAP